MFAEISINGYFYHALVNNLVNKKDAYYIYFGKDEVPVIRHTDNFEIVQELKVQEAKSVSEASFNQAMTSLKDLIGQDIAEIKFK